MLKHAKITEDRIHVALHRIQALLYPETHPVELSAWHAPGEPVSYQTAVQETFLPFLIGGAWGPAWSTTWFRIRGEVPATWNDREVVVVMKFMEGGREGFTAEGLIYSEGEPVRALNANRSEIEVGRPAKGGEKCEFYVEAAANLSDECDRKISLTDPLFQVIRAELAVVNRGAFDYYYDFKIATNAMQGLPANSQRRAELRQALNESINLLDLENPATISAAREALAGVLSKRNGDTVHQISAIGHAHIDTAWLWPLRETIRKCARTFSTALDYMEKYPEYIFGCSQAQQYDWMKVWYPTIYERIRQAVQRGQWECIGSMWVEVDCNLASGESLIRQILKGKHYFQQEFGCETRDVWIPDVFGYSAALPQIFKGCGVEYFVTQKISWSQFNKFPHHTFYWEGIDGTQIFTHFPPADTYNGDMTPQQLIYHVDNFKDHGSSQRSIYAYGFGDGGGGPTLEMLELARRMEDFDGLPQVKSEKVIEFLAKAKNEAKELPVWVGELYLELHRGTYTTQAKNKLGNRRSEFLLRDAEFFDAVSLFLNPERVEKAVDPERALYDVTGVNRTDSHLHARALDRAWKLVLLNQFHDIIPGSSIGWVYEDSTRDYLAIAALGESVLTSALGSFEGEIHTAEMRQPVRLINTLGFSREEVVDLPGGKPTAVKIPACGYAVINAAGLEAAPFAPVEVASLKDGYTLSNGLLQIQIGPDGLLSGIRDLAAGREVLAPDCSGNLFQLHPDNPIFWDAWDVDVYYRETCQELREVEKIEWIETDPLRAKLRVTRRFGKSCIVQEIVLTAGSRRIDFVTEVDWHEDHKFLKVAFPVNILSPRATYEIQFGNLERPTHFNTSWDVARFEVCAQKWADLSEPGYGVALLNNCKYGYDIHGNTLRLSLLRSPTAPDPTADRGHHRFTYSLLPHTGDFREGRVIEQAYQLNVPLRISPLPVQTGKMPAQFSFIEVDRPGVQIEAVKVAETGDAIIIRLYEAHGSRGPATVAIHLPFAQVFLTDLLEQNPQPIEVVEGRIQLDLRPFQIVTLKLTPKLKGRLFQVG